jgi:putative peptidoglycan lipid II flippase
MSATKDQNEFSHTASNAGLIGVTAMLGALVGFVLQLLVAFNFGASNQTDAYFMALSTSEMLSKLLLGGSITAVFLPMFVARLAKNKRSDAWHLALNILHITLFAYIFILALIAIFAGSFISFIAPGFDSATHTLTTSLLLVLLPSFAVLYLVELSTSMLQALEHFVIPALFRIITPTVSIISIILLLKHVGIFSLAIGVVIGSFIQLSLVFWALYRQGFKYRFIFKPFDPAIKRLVYLTYPFLFSVLMTQGAGITYRILVSDLSEGSLSAIKFAEKITQLLTIVFLNSVTMVIYPILSKKAAQHDMVGLRNTIASSLRLITFTTLPIIVGVALLRNPITAFLYQRGSFSASDTAMTSIALLFLVMGLTTNGISSVFGHATLALQKTRAAVAVTMASQVVAIGLFLVLVPVMSHAGLALASSLVPISIALLYFLYLTKFIPNLISVFLHVTYIKIIVLSVLMGLLVYVSAPVFSHLSSVAQLSLFLQVFVPTILGATFYFLCAYFWCIPEMHDLLDIFRSKLGKLKVLKSSR